LAQGAKMSKLCITLALTQGEPEMRFSLFRATKTA